MCISVNTEPTERISNRIFIYAALSTRIRNRLAKKEAASQLPTSAMRFMVITVLIIQH